MPSDDSHEELPVTQETPTEAPDVSEHPDTIINRWWNDRMPGSPLARVTDAYNHVYEAVQDLKNRLKGAR